MAAATIAVPPALFDLRAPTTLSIRLGSSILKPAAARKYTAVRYNHKPKTETSSSAPSAQIATTNKHHTVELVLTGEDGDEYTYSGKDTSDGRQYVLLYTAGGDGGKDAGMTLERLESCYDFNLVATSQEQDAARLSEKYPLLPSYGDSEDDLFGEDEDEESPVDEDNPFDYRHFLNAASPVLPAAKIEPAPRTEVYTAAPAKGTKPKTLASTKATVKESKPVASITTGKRKAGEPTARKSNAKRVKAGAESPEAQSPPTKARPTAPTIPKVRLDRKASLRRQSFDDSGELILENETPISEKPPRQNAMSLALNRQLGRGPISLRSAASSPARRTGSPAASRSALIDDEGEVDLDLGTPIEAGQRGGSRKKTAADDGAYFDIDDGVGHDPREEDEEEANADIEDLDLPSPAQELQRAPPPPSAIGAGDDEDDLDKQLALAMAEDDDGPPPAAPAESDEESEEE